MDVRAAQHSAGEQGEQFGLLRGEPRLAGPGRGGVDQRGDRHGDDEQHHGGDEVVRFGNGEAVARFGEEEVEQQAGQQGRDDGGADSAEQGDGEHDDEEQRVLAGHPGEAVDHGHQGGRDEGDDGCRDPGLQSPLVAAQQRHLRASGRVLVGHHVHVDPAGVADDRRPDALVEDAGPSRAPRRAEHELGRVHLPREVEQRGGHVVADDAVQAGAQTRGEGPDLSHLRRRDTGEAVAPDDVHDHQLRARLGGDAAGPAHQGLRFGPAGDGDDDALAGLPGVGDGVFAAVLRERKVDLIGEPQQGDLAQGGQVPFAEVVAQRGIDVLRRVDVAVRETPLQRLRGDVDELDLVGAPYDVVGHGLALHHAGDLLDDVVEGLEVLDVDRGQDVDARVEQFLDVLPAFGVPAARHVGVGELVDQGDRRPAGQHGVEVEFVEHGVAVRHPPWRDDLEAGQLLGGARPPVRVHDRHHHVGASADSPMGLPQHGERLSRAGGGTEVDPQPSPARRLGDGGACGTGHDAIIHPRGPRRSRVQSVPGPRSARARSLVRRRGTRVAGPRCARRPARGPVARGCR